MRSNYTPSGKCVVYIKSVKETDISKALIKEGIGTRCSTIDQFIEEGVRKNYKPVLEQAITKCNEKAAKLVIANIGHLPRSLAFCNACMKLEGDDPYIIAIRSTDHRASAFKYHVSQMYFQCLDHIDATSKKAKKSIAEKKATGWKAGNPINLDVATANATRARERLADDYCKAIIPEIRRIQRYGKVTLQEIANALMAQSIKTRRGKDTWTPMGVSNVLNKAKKLEL
tara:strand:- start:1433 stop:2116 length:684 start_codon:yes stop_codon:yes gene_type:complete